jgi:hypothetical protein
LKAGEEPVECEEGMMVWNVCDAKFAIYEELRSDTIGRSRLYQELPDLEGRNQLIAVGMPGAETEIRKLYANLLEQVDSSLGNSATLFSSLYRHGGKEAHPDMHPEIGSDHIGGSQWLMIVLVVNQGVRKTRDERMEKLVGEWVKEKGTAEMKYGVWYGEVDLS